MICFFYQQSQVPSMKWVDNHKGVFCVALKAESSVFAQVRCHCAGITLGNCNRFYKLYKLLTITLFYYDLVCSIITELTFS